MDAAGTGETETEFDELSEEMNEWKIDCFEINEYRKEKRMIYLKYDEKKREIVLCGGMQQEK